MQRSNNGAFASDTAAAGGDNMQAAAGYPAAATQRENPVSCEPMTPAAVGYYTSGGPCNPQPGAHPCSGCRQQNYTSFHLCSWCQNPALASERQAQADRDRWSMYRSGNAIMPASGSFSFDRRGAWQPFGQQCTLNRPTVSDIAPPGMHACKVGEPNVWTLLPNNIPCAVGVNDYHHGLYIHDIYETTRSQPYGFTDPGAPTSPPARVLNPYTPGWVQPAGPRPGTVAEAHAVEQAVAASVPVAAGGLTAPRTLRLNGTASAPLPLDTAKIERLWREAQFSTEDRVAVSP